MSNEKKQKRRMVLLAYEALLRSLYIFVLYYVKGLSPRFYIARV